LENVIGAAVALCDGPLICANDLLFAADQVQTPGSFREAKAQLITEFEREYIVCLLASCDGNVSEAARAAGKNRRAFWELIRKHKIDVRGLRTSEKRASRTTNAHASGFATR
jgi:transcriptional regulator of acetoin/glycerol metabolism